MRFWLTLSSFTFIFHTSEQRGMGWEADGTVEHLPAPQGRTTSFLSQGKEEQGVQRPRALLAKLSLCIEAFLFSFGIINHTAQVILASFWPACIDWLINAHEFDSKWPINKINKSNFAFVPQGKIQGSTVLWLRDIYCIWSVRDVFPDFQSGLCNCSPHAEL